ncbi:MAG: TonB-dependent receptor [Sphingobacteriales bacterium]|nr:MAG: TonB-dependent receptor [Sphingobacteriales bacterium]
MLKYFLVFVYMVIANEIFAQTGQLTGNIFSEGKSVPYASISIKNTRLGAAANSDGKFEIKNIPAGKYEVNISCLDYAKLTDSITVLAGNTSAKNFELKPESNELQEVVVTGTMKETFLKESPIKVEVLTAKFFLTSPSNNIMEALHTVNGVQEQINCGVCGTNDIHINGMEGPYTLVLIDGMPIVSSLSSVYGFNGIPTHLIKRVEIVKGPASSLYGSEAVGGVINIITQSPETAPKLSVNSFYTTHREWNTDISTALKINKKTSTLFGATYYRNQFKIDHNKDNFTDIPLNNRLSIFSKWNFNRKNNRTFSFAARYYTEDRFGGVLQWKPQHRGDTIIYGENIQTNRIELIGSYQLPIIAHKIRLDISFNNHDQKSYYGATPYNATQKVFFGNLIYDTILHKHNLLFGATYKQQVYDDNTPATIQKDVSKIPGLFIQDEIKFSYRTSLLLGWRTDFHQKHGLVSAPRFALKYLPTERSTIRVNAGKGFRLVNIFTEEHAALTGARTVMITEQLKPEQSYNLNINYNVTYAALGGSGTLDVDVFYTYFNNKILPDYNTDPNLIIYRNLSGHAEVRGFSLSADHQFKFPIKVKTGFTFADVFEMDKNATGENEKTPQVFAPQFSGTFQLTYIWKKPGLTLDYTGRVTGPQHLPVFPEAFHKAEKSPWFTLQHIQLTKQFKDKNYQVYAGVKNIWNYTQGSPLIAPENPFSKEFDTSYAWGPLQTRRLFLGFRYNLK